MIRPVRYKGTRKDPKGSGSQVDLEGKMSGDVPTPQVRNGLSVRHLGGVVSTPHVIRYIHVTHMF